ncbi:MAG: hypothetical protein HN995_00160, partial [Candidatus Marinimicrobia bacterium]|nr:hypothetical protein [Candidatus Neomarinimicrobiota bacterium]MBT3952179.1 hypothetical protein [Candidatus Neomarinimicrobiota bacterium]MBT6945575.1 hypothetical protein [Candidatus Neomarinimicrobiota bacterium]
MKRLITLAIFVPIIALCTTYNTISVNGSNSDWESDEDLVTTSVGYTDYFTWDASNLYFAIGGSDADTDNKVHFIYIDTDPQTTATNGTGTTSSIAWNLTHTLPFTANYAFAYKVQSGDDYYNLNSTRKCNSKDIAKGISCHSLSSRPQNHMRSTNAKLQAAYPGAKIR